jgi:hypothetical protein
MKRPRQPKQLSTVIVIEEGKIVTMEAPRAFSFGQPSEKSRRLNKPLRRPYRRPK